MSKFYHPLMFNNFTKSDLIKVSKFVRTQNILTQNITLKKSIQNDVKSKLAYHEYPRIIEFVEELPMTTTGKIIRKDLRERN